MFWSLNLCRICSQICEICVPIFDQTSSPSVDIKIKRCMSAIITKDDMKPHQVCRPCLSKLNDFYNFISLFYDSNYKFENTLFHYSLQHPPQHTSGVLTQECVELELPLVHNTIPECSNLSADVIPLPSNNTEVCVLGDQHLLGEIEQVDILNAQTTLINSEQNCSKNCVTESNYYILEPTPQTLSNRNKESNLISVPSLINSYKPPEKQCERPSKIRKSRPFKNNIKVAKFTCAKCSNVFSRKQRLTEHLLKHMSVRSYMCDQCGKTFAVKCDLTVHKRTHTSTLCCKYCSKPFSSPSKLQRHIRTHTNERPFVCTVENCSMAFSDKRNLVGHQVTHSNIRNFKCNICTQYYKTKSQLSDHMIAHSETPKFCCKICGKFFKWKASLYMHKINVHFKVKSREEIK